MTLRLVGKRFGHLRVIADGGSILEGREGRRCRTSICICDCGNEHVVRNSQLSSGKTRSCGCLRRESVSLPDGVAADNLAISIIKRNAIARQLLWELTDETVRTFVGAPCYWCGAVRANRHGRGVNKTRSGYRGWNGIDRLDSSIGYILGNVVPCCGVCNRMKSTLSAEAFLAQCKRIASRERISPSERLHEIEVAAVDAPREPREKLGVK